MNLISVGFSIHRPEIVPVTARLMEQHDVIFLEEPPESSHTYSPGDQLTLAYVFHPGLCNDKWESLMAARSIIYSKIVQVDTAKARLAVADHVTTHYQKRVLL
jgi:hypothetical protein